MLVPLAGSKHGPPTLRSSPDVVRKRAAPSPSQGSGMPDDYNPTSTSMRGASQQDGLLDVRTPEQYSFSFNGVSSGGGAAKLARYNYWMDWGIVGAMILITGCSQLAQPRDAYITKVGLSAVSYPLRDNSVPSWTVPIIGIVIPAVVVAGHNLLLRRSRVELHHLLLALMTAVFLNAAITNCLKVPIGRLRPDFVARCWPDGAVNWAREDNFGGYAVCSGPADVVSEGRRSFPSGHSSWAACGLGFVSLFMLDRLRAFEPGAPTWRLLSSLVPSLCALIVGVSRITDYWHHWSDVLAGLTLGFGIATLVWVQQRPRLGCAGAGGADDEAQRAKLQQRGAGLAYASLPV